MEALGRIDYWELLVLGVGVLFALIFVWGAVRVFMAAIWGKPPPLIRDRQARAEAAERGDDAARPEEPTEPESPEAW